MLDFIAKYWIQCLFGLALSVMGLGFKKINKRFKEQDNVKMGVRALLKNQIIQMYNKYIDLGYIPIYALESVESMYTEYHALGGNGTITELVEKLKDLPTKKTIKTEKREEEI